MIGERFSRVIVGAALVAVCGATVPVGASNSTTKESAFYFVSAHADDEAPGWQLIDDFQSHYGVFVLLTRGEGTYACLTKEQAETYADAPREVSVEGGQLDANRPASGPYMYEGPGSPVGEEDLGERHPIGDPWVGWYTNACKRARIASWHWFLDDVAALDPGFPDFGIADRADGDPWADDDYRGRRCPPDDDARTSRRHRFCADVWADETGARISFDLGDNRRVESGAEPFTEADVLTALELVRDHRRSWGIPVLPEAGVMAAAPGCHREGAEPADHGDHETIHNALFATDVGAGPRYGTVCDESTNRIGRAETTGTVDRRYAAAPGTDQPHDAVEWWALNSIDPVTRERTGPSVVNYGWLGDLGGVGERPEWNFPLHKTWRRE